MVEENVDDSVVENELKSSGDDIKIHRVLHPFIVSVVFSCHNSFFARKPFLVISVIYVNKSVDNINQLENV